MIRHFYMPFHVSLSDCFYTLCEYSNNHSTQQLFQDWVHDTESGLVNTLISDLYASTHTALEPW